MRSSFFHGVGGVLSADIAVPEHARELAFYARVLTTGQTPLWLEDLSNNKGTPIIGLGERIPEYEALPLQWMPHFQVADVGASAARTVELGGQELMHGKDDAGQSQWAVLVDPAGAAFGVIAVVPDDSGGAGQAERVGRIVWLSLAASDVATTGAFYERVIGWTAAGAGDDGVCEMRSPDGAGAAEIGPSHDGSEGVPPVWMIHLPVGDLAASLQHVREGGGEVVWEAPGGGHAVIRDPVGVCLALCADG